jgi:hypothetical protein
MEKMIQEVELYKTASSECEKNAHGENGGSCELSVILPFSRTRENGLFRSLLSQNWLHTHPVDSIALIYLLSYLNRFCILVYSYLSYPLFDDAHNLASFSHLLRPFLVAIFEVSTCQRRIFSSWSFCST